MKNRITLILALLGVLSAGCRNEGGGYVVPDPQDVVMYQVNPRVFAPDNSFMAVASHLDSIKALGTNVVWFMPVCEIGRDERAKSSPYCVRDYKGVNPEFGTLEDFKYVIAECHKRGMAVIMDWVANHSSWDNQWLADNPEWYTHDENGEIISPKGTNWLDVADFNFDNAEMRLAMIDAMKWWVTEAGIDGFRCDAADFVPFDFWKQCVDSLRAIPGHKLLMLAEGARKDHFQAGFEMDYAWGYMATLRRIFNGRGKTPVSALFEADAKEYEGIPEGCVKLRFTTNHDETDKMSPVREFHGERGSMAAFVATVFIRGGALVYSSQEIAYPGRINFFHYVPMDWQSRPEIYKEYIDLLGIYKAHPAIRKGSLTPYPDDDILVFEREHEGDRVLVLVNLTQEREAVDVPEGWAGKTATDLYGKKKLKLGKTIEIDPYAYLILG